MLWWEMEESAPSDSSEPVPPESGLAGLGDTRRGGLPPPALGQKFVCLLFFYSLLLPVYSLTTLLHSILKLHPLPIPIPFKN